MIDKIKAAAREAAKAVVADFSPLLGTPGDAEDDSTEVIAGIIEREMLASLLPDTKVGTEGRADLDALKAYKPTSFP